MDIIKSLFSIASSLFLLAFAVVTTIATVLFHIVAVIVGAVFGINLLRDASQNGYPVVYDVSRKGKK